MIKKVRSWIGCLSMIGLFVTVISFFAFIADFPLLIGLPAKNTLVIVGLVLSVHGALIALFVRGMGVDPYPEK